jgi:hypothetical protein
MVRVHVFQKVLGLVGGGEHHHTKSYFWTGSIEHARAS